MTEERYRVEWKYNDGEEDGPNEFISGATYTREEAEARCKELADGDAFDIEIVPDRGI